MDSAVIKEHRRSLIVFLGLGESQICPEYFLEFFSYKVLTA